MIVYQYSEYGLFEGETFADESPLEPGVFLIPARCTEKPPPEINLSKDQRFKWDGDQWVIISVDSDAITIAKLKRFLEQNPDVLELISR